METRRDTSAAERDHNRWVALSVVDETLSTAERRFGAKIEGHLLDRYALEAAIELLSAPARVTTFLPDLAMRQVRDAIVANGVDR